MGYRTIMLLSDHSKIGVMMQTKPCVACGKDFKRNPSYSRKQWADAMYCSRACQQPVTLATYRCAVCDRPIERRVARAKFKTVICSPECATEAKRRPRGWENAKKWFCALSGRWKVWWKEDGSEVIHKANLARWVWAMAHGPIPNGAQIHHINGDKTDDRLENLQLVLSDYEHKKIHNAEIYQNTEDGTLERKCSRCEEFKPIEEFYMRKSGKGAGYRVAICSECGNSIRRQRRASRNKPPVQHPEYRIERWHCGEGQPA